MKCKHWLVLVAMLMCYITVSECFSQALDRTHVVYVNPLQYGAACDDTTLQAAVTAIGTDNKTLILTRTNRGKVDCTWTLANNVTIPENVMLWVPQGVRVSVNSTKTLTVNGQVYADDPDWWTGAGSVVYGWKKDTVDSSYVMSGCLPTVPVTSLTFGAFSCSAWVLDGVQGIPIRQASNSVGPLNSGDGTYWIAVHRSKTQSVSSWTRESNTNYMWRKSASEPTPLAAGLMIIAKVIVSSDVIDSVVDYRVPRSYVYAKHFDITDPLYGGACDGGASGGGTDNVTAWGLAVNAAKVKGGVVYIPRGFCSFTSQPAAVGGGVMIRGAGMDATYLVRAYSEGTDDQGFIDMDANNAGDDNVGGGVEHLTLWTPSGTTGGTGINGASSSTIGQGRLLVDWVRVSGDGTWAYNIRMDGSLKTDSPAGIRFVVVRSVFLAQATEVGLIVLGVNHAMLTEVGIFTGSGTADLIVDGGTGGGVQTNDVVIHCEFCPKVELGKTQPTQAVNFTTTYTTDLTISTNLSFFTMSGSVKTLVGSFDPQAPAVTGMGFMTQGKILAGVGGPTSDGGHLETRNGVTFPATAVTSTNANTLDAYEDKVLSGSGLPVVVGSTAAGAGTYTKQAGYYTRIGRMVFFTLQLVWTAHTGTGFLNVSIPGLPANASDETDYFAATSVYYTNLLVTANMQLVTLFQPNSKIIYLYAADPSAALGSARVALDTAATLVISGSYRIKE